MPTVSAERHLWRHDVAREVGWTGVERRRGKILALCKTKRRAAELRLHDCARERSRTEFSLGGLCFKTVEMGLMVKKT